MATGQTSEIWHRTALVERHWVIVGELPRRGDRITAGRRRAVLAQVHAVADPLLAAAGLSRTACQEYERPGELGVTWTIVVGECATGRVDRHDPYWAWTPRWRHWCAVLGRMALKDRKDRTALTDLTDSP